jgi:hypothetical protein
MTWVMQDVFQPAAGLRLSLPAAGAGCLETAQRLTWTPGCLVTDLYPWRLPAAGHLLKDFQ